MITANGATSSNAQSQPSGRIIFKEKHVHLAQIPADLAIVTVYFFGGHLLQGHKSSGVFTQVCAYGMGSKVAPNIEPGAAKTTTRRSRSKLH